MRPLFVSFYTVGSPYEGEARGLIESLEAFDLDCEILGIQSRGSWQANTQAKAAFVRDFMHKHPNRALVWIDADARVKRKPDLFDTLTASDCDFAAHWREGWELLSGTLYFSGSMVSVQLVDAWIDECRRNPEVYDQACLQAVVMRFGPALRVTRLPPGYTAIFDYQMVPEGQEIILHRQASRRLRGQIN